LLILASAHNRPAFSAKEIKIIHGKRGLITHFHFDDHFFAKKNPRFSSEAFCCIFRHTTSVLPSKEIKIKTGKTERCRHVFFVITDAKIKVNL
jgi:hypothetical protein